MRHIITKTGEVRPDRKCAEYRALRKAAARYVEGGRGISEFAGAMGRQGFGDEAIFMAWNDANGGKSW
jgi:hypothetical protein